MTKTKYWALLAIVPLFVGILIGMSFQTYDAEALKAEGTGLSPKSYGTATEGIVCGDKLCSDATPAAPMPLAIKVIEDEMPDYMPTLDFKNVYQFQRDALHTYSIMFGVTAGQANLENIIIECKSDVDSIQTTVTSLSALTSTENLVRIKAMDPASITGEIISFQIAG